MLHGRGRPDLDDVRLRGGVSVPMDTFKVGDKVARRAAPHTRAIVTRLTDDGDFVTVAWSLRFEMEGRESTHRPEDLVRLTL